MACGHLRLGAKASGRHEGQLRAQCVNPYFMLRALAAMEMPREGENTCRRAAGEPAIHADRSEDRRSNSQFADKW